MLCCHADVFKTFGVMQTFTLLCKNSYQSFLYLSVLSLWYMESSEYQGPKKGSKLPWDMFSVFINVLIWTSHIYFRSHTILLWILLLSIIHHNHTHTYWSVSAYISIVLQKTLSMMLIISHLRHLTSLNAKQKKQGREQEVTNEEEEGEWEGNV